MRDRSSPAPAPPGLASGTEMTGRTALMHDPYRIVSVSTGALARVLPAVEPELTISNGRVEPRAHSDATPRLCSRSTQLAAVLETRRSRGAWSRLNVPGLRAARVSLGHPPGLVFWDHISHVLDSWTALHRRFVLQHLGKPLLARILNVLCIRPLLHSGLLRSGGIIRVASISVSTGSFVLRRWGRR